LLEPVCSCGGYAERPTQKEAKNGHYQCFEHSRFFGRAGGETRGHLIPAQHDLPKAIRDTEILYTFRALPDPDQAPSLRWVQLHTAGAERVLSHPLYTQTEILFTTTSGIHAINMAEYVMAQILAFAHRIPLMLNDQTKGTWASERWLRYIPDELYEKTIGIVGYGSIGRQVARLARAFGMSVLAIKRDAKDPADSNYVLPNVGDPEGNLPDRIYPPQAIRSFLSECDYVVLAVPLTEETHHLIDAEKLKAMKENSLLVNVARGAVVDEKALIKALNEGWIAGAVLDVFEEEPLPEDSPLWKTPNLTISPHVSGLTPHYHERAAGIFAENLRRYVAGQPLANLVERERGY
jgi:phosphoglycerate dehydrogenase-like enzyme